MLTPELQRPEYHINRNAHVSLAIGPKILFPETSWRPAVLRLLTSDT